MFVFNVLIIFVIFLLFIISIPMITIIIVSNQGGCLLPRPVEMLGIHELQQLPEQNNHDLRLNTKCDDRANRSPVLTNLI